VERRTVRHRVHPPFGEPAIGPSGRRRLGPISVLFSVLPLVGGMD
jgi:hypothetical protein